MIEGERITLAFTYCYGFRMRPNSIPKPLYSGILHVDGPFVIAALNVFIEGRKDEQKRVLRGYSIRLNTPFTKQPVPASLIQQLDCHPPIVLEGKTLGIDLIRTSDIPKLRKRRSSGRGIDLEVALHGWKSYPKPTAHPEAPEVSSQHYPTTKEQS
jgi:hypothetical protein